MSFVNFSGCFLSHLEFLMLQQVVSHGLLRQLNLRIVTDLIVKSKPWNLKESTPNFCSIYAETLVNYVKNRELKVAYKAKDFAS